MNLNKIPKIQVLIRKRPLSKKQQFYGETDIISVQNNQTIIVKQKKFKVDMTPFIEEYHFNFDEAFSEKTTNQEIYAKAVKNLVDCAFDGARVSCFAYGQTGSGKTHTMLGNGQDIKGLYLLAAEDIFYIILKFRQLSVWISFYQIYCGKLYDLLNGRNLLYAREDAKNNINIVGLSERKIKDVEDLIQIIEFGMSIRITAQNGTNIDSSRSHAILQITLKNHQKIHGKISFIDLAGSQRAADHADQIQKQTRIDGAEINKSLLALKECIRALDQNKNHTPFRGSKLTMVLKDSFTGYCRSVMIGNISPNSSSCENTLNTLKYADRVKQLKKPNKQKIIELDHLTELTKQLMLPRQNIQKKYFGEIKEGLNSYSKKNKNQDDPEATKMIKQILQTPSFIKQNQRKKIGVIQNRSKTNVLNDRKGSSQIKNQANKNNILEALSFEQLQKHHQTYIQQIIEQQDHLLKQHEQHINFSIDLIKKEMLLMSQADKIGSNIDDYLQNLETVLEKEANSIHSLLLKAKKMKIHLKQSQNIEKIYLERIQHENNSQLDDNHYLFK